MNILTEPLVRILRRARAEGDQIGEQVGDGLYLKAFANGVINVDARHRDLTPGDLDAVRAALVEAGYVEVDSWVATQGASWLSPGISAGVSFRTRPADRTE